MFIEKERRATATLVKNAYSKVNVFSFHWMPFLGPASDGIVPIMFCISLNLEAAMDEEDDIGVEILGGVTSKH
jgi:hypothetical protein